MITLLPFLGFIKDFFVKILSDWRVILVIALLGVSWYGYRQYSEMNTTIVDLKASNATLVTDINMLNAAAKEKTLLIEQLQLDKALQAETIANMGKRIETTNRSVVKITQKIDDVKAVPVPLSPFLKEALIGITDIGKQ